MNDQTDLPSVIVDKITFQPNTVRFNIKKNAQNDINIKPMLSEYNCVKKIDTERFFWDKTYLVDGKTKVIAIDGTITLSNASNDLKTVDIRYVELKVPIENVHLYKKNQNVSIFSSLCDFKQDSYNNSKDTVKHMIAIFTNNRWKLLEDIPAQASPNRTVKIEGVSPLSKDYTVHLQVPITVITDIAPDLMWPEIESWNSQVNVCAIGIVKEEAQPLGDEYSTQNINGFSSILIKPITKLVSKTVAKFGSKRASKLAAKTAAKTGTQTTAKAGAKTGTQTTAKAGAKTGTQTATKAGATTGTQTTAKTGAKTGTQTTAKAGAETGTKAATETTAKTGAETSEPGFLTQVAAETAQGVLTATALTATTGIVEAVLLPKNEQQVEEEQVVEEEDQIVEEEV